MPLHDIGVLTKVDRAALAAYCQAYGRWVEAEENMKKTPLMLKTPSGYVQQSPWLSVANKQLEIMGRYMTELGMTPAARTRVATVEEANREPITIVRLIGMRRDEDGTWWSSTAPARGPSAEASEHGHGRLETRQSSSGSAAAST